MKIQFSTSNAAFGETYAEMTSECIRILDEITTQIQAGYTSKAVMDINGNKIGEWELED